MRPSDLRVTVRRPERGEELRSRHGVHVLTDNAQAVRGAAVVLLTLGWAGVAEAAKRPRLKAFASCTQLVDYERAGAVPTNAGETSAT